MLRLKFLPSKFFQALRSDKFYESLRMEVADLSTNSVYILSQL